MPTRRSSRPSRTSSPSRSTTWRCSDQVEQERARLEAESTKLNDILGAATDGIVSVLADGTIEAWNPGMARITGVEPEVAIGQPWHAVLRLQGRCRGGARPDRGPRHVAGDGWRARR